MAIHEQTHFRVGTFDNRCSTGQIADCRYGFGQKPSQKMQGTEAKRVRLDIHSRWF